MPIQAQLDLDYATKHSHTGDPVTSLRAAEKARVFAPKHIETIYEVLLDVGEPLLAEEIAARCPPSIDTSEVSRRIHEVVDADNAVRCGKRSNSRGNPSTLYVVACALCHGLPIDHICDMHQKERVVDERHEAEGDGDDE